MINAALRTENVEALLTYRFYIRDLCSCLLEQSRSFRKRCSRTELTTYRGVTLCQKEIERLRNATNQFISTNTFFSTSYNQNVAKMFAGVGNSVAVDEDFSSVIFKIEIDLNNHDVVLADVSSLSQFQQEEEILFDLGSVFKIEKMEFDTTDNVWICRVKTSNKHQAIAHDYIELKRKEMNSSNVIILLGTLLFDMGEFVKSKEYLKDLNTHIPDNFQIIFGLGRAEYALNNYDEALKYYEEAYAICMNTDSTNIIHINMIHDSIAVIYRCRSQYKKALTCYLDALHKYDRIGMIETVQYVHVLNAISFIYYRLGADEHALSNAQRALHIIQSVTDFDHPELSEAHWRIGLALYHLGDYESARISMEKSLNIAKHILPSTHVKIACIISGIAKMLYKQKYYELAYSKHQEALEINKFTLSDNTNYLFAMLYNNIGKVSYRMKRFEEAKMNYEKAFTALKKRNIDRVEIAYTMKNQAEVFLAQNKFEESLHYLDTALQIYQSVHVEGEHRDKAKCIHLLGRIYLSKGELQQALSYFRNAYISWKGILVASHPELKLCQKDIAQVHWQKIRSKLFMISISR